MAKLKSNDIGVSDLQEYLDQESDFAFELKVLEKMTSLGFQADHGGTYKDPQKSILRQFDIRARKKLGYVFLNLAIECKQIRSNYPLLISRIPRSKEESYHDILLTIDRGRFRFNDDNRFDLDPDTKSFSVEDSDSIYPPSEQVGKSCAQVGRDNNGITGSDSEMFSKWSQAICSAEAMADEHHHDVPTDSIGWMYSIYLPVVVVPDNRLWVIDYKPDGMVDCEPRLVNSCSYFIGSTCSLGGKINSVSYRFSHLNFVTFSELDAFLNRLGNKEGPTNKDWFPRPKARQLFAPRE